MMTTFFIFSLFGTIKSDMPSKFIRLECSLKTGTENGHRMSVQWRRPGQTSTISQDKDLFVSVRQSGDKEAKAAHLYLFIRKHKAKPGVFVCSSSPAVFWSFDGVETVRQLSDTQVEQTYGDWMHQTSNGDGELPESSEAHLSWSERAGITLALLTSSPTFSLPLVILILTALVYVGLLYAIFSVSEKVLESAAAFARIAFIMTEGEKVKTLAKLKRHFQS